MTEPDTTGAANPGEKRFLRSTLALLPPFGALFLQLVLWPLIIPQVWFLFFPAVFISSWIGGVRAGLGATALSTALVLWFFVPPEHSFVKPPILYFPAAVFLAAGALFGAFHDRLRKANRRIAEALGASERANERLKKIANERRVFAAFAENSSDFIGIAGADGTPVYVNPAGRRMVGLAADHPVESTQISEYYPPEQRAFASDVIVKSMVEKGLWQGETYFRHWQTGAAIPVSDTHFMIRDPETGQVLGMGTITRDISDLRRARDQLQTLFSNVSHELRTPLALILGPTERLLRAPDTSDAVRRDLEVIARNARLLLGHVNDLLDVAKLEAGQMKPDYAEVDLSRLARFVAGHFEILSKERGTELKVEAPDTLPAQVDSEKVQRILLNLLSNAFKLTPAGGRVRMTLRGTPGRASLEIADSGPGIPPDEREAVFERFRQLEGGATRRLGGTGLGLSIARELTLLHGGSISVSEAPEGGASFVVELPRAAPPGAVVRPEVEAAEEPAELRQVVEKLRRPPGAIAPSSGAAESALVLVVEDNPEMARFVSESLAAEYRVAVAFDGKEGLEKAKALLPDLILCDVMMPEMSGDELVRAARRRPELDATPIVVLTAKADDELMVKLLREGAQDYLTKPFSVEELRARVANLVARKRADELVRQAEAKLRGIISIASDAIISIDEEQRIVLYNEGAEAIFGWSRDDVMGKPLDVLLPPRFREAHRKHVRDFMTGEVKARRMGEVVPAVVGLRKSGAEFQAQAVISKLRTGGAWLFTVILRDVSEHARIEREDKFLAEVGSVLASTLDYEATPYNVASLVVRELADVCFVETVEGEDQLVRRLKVAYRDPGKAATAGALQRVRLDRRRAHLGSSVLDTRRPLLMSEVAPDYLESISQSDEHLRALRELDPKSLLALPLLAHGRLVGAMVLVSTTEARRYAPEDLRLAEKVASRAALAVENARLYRLSQRATQARDEVLGVVAHDLRNPLGTIRLQANLLRRRGQEPERRSRTPADVIERAVTRMNHLIQDLLDVTRLEAGQLSIVQGRLPAERVVAEALAAQKALASAASLELRLEVAQDVPEVWADRDRLLQVFENLIGNALKFTEPGGRITVGAARRDGDALFWVADTGVGISAENLPHVFERFWQAQKGERHGAGLGLPIVKGIVEAHGGRIWVESTPGRGSTFFFTIPVAPGAEEGRPEPTPYGP